MPPRTICVLSHVLGEGNFVPVDHIPALNRVHQRLRLPLVHLQQLYGFELARVSIYRPTQIEVATTSKVGLTVLLSAQILILEAAIARATTNELLCSFRVSLNVTLREDVFCNACIIKLSVLKCLQVLQALVLAFSV